MAPAANQTATTSRKRSFTERWFFVGIASIMIVTTIAGFLPAIISPATRHAPLSHLTQRTALLFSLFSSSS